MSTSDEQSREIPRLTEHLFRHESEKMVSALVRIFGIHRLQMAEDVVQEAMIRALQTWPYYGVPANPAAWLMQTAKNRALDLVRREKLFYEKQPEIADSLARLPNEEDSAQFNDDIQDDRLRLIFACCHPLIPSEDQTVLALKTLCGFSIGEIAAAFLSSEAAIAKRLTRAKQKIQDAGIPFEIPAGPELVARLDGVLQILYLLFSEGYKASSGESVVRADLCHEAIRLCTALANHPVTDSPRVHALLSLMLLDASRLPAREDEAGKLLRLSEQDRSRWSREMIGDGLRHLACAATGVDLSEYHLQAGIAACHCTAPNYESTDWPRILAHYDRWMTISTSPIVALNRAVAVANVHGCEAGMAAIDDMPNRRQLDSYYLLHAVLGDFAEQLGSDHEAAAHFRKALELTGLDAERSFLAERLLVCETATAR